MLTLTEEQLEFVLKQFQGSLINPRALTEYQKFSLSFFTNPEKVIYPHVAFTTQLDITNIYSVYQEHYKSTPGATFTAYLKWILIKAMQDTSLTWRYINNQWYDFKNLPLELSVYVNDQRGQLLYFLDDVTHLSWKDFCHKHFEAARGLSEDDTKKIQNLPFYAMAHEIVGLHIPGILTSYDTTKKAKDSHNPWIIFNTPYTNESGKKFMPLRVSFSHAATTPAVVSKFVEKFVRTAQTPPITHHLQAKL